MSSIASHASLGQQQSSSSSAQLPIMHPSVSYPRTTEEQRIDDVDASYRHQQDVLTSPWSPARRLDRSPALSPASINQNLYSSPDVVIQSHQNNNYITSTGHHVPSTLSDVSQSSLTSSTQFYKNVSPGQSLGSSQLPSASRVYHHQHAPLNNSIGLRTTPVFETTSQLAAHYGIPRKLPPAPRVNINQTTTKPPVPLFNQPQPPTSRPEPSSSSQVPVDTQDLISSYLNMLNRNSEDTQNVEQSPAATSTMTNQVSAPETDVTAAQSILDVLCSPEWNDFLTSPYDESPFEKLLETPALGTSELDFYTSPVVASADTSLQQNPQDLQLFPTLPETNTSGKMAVTTMPPPQAPTNFDGLFTMSPYTPSLDPLSLNSPAIVDSPSGLDDNSRSRSRQPTGTRKGVTPETLVPLNAPTQPRNYNGPSTTSRKELPAVFARKRARTVFEEEDELLEEATSGPVTSTEAEAIQAKRRQNTLAARRSRKRKLEYQQSLEDEVERQRLEIEMWRTRALTYQQHLRSMGVMVGDDAV